MKYYFTICVLVVNILKSFSQDSLFVKEIKISECNVFVTKPIIFDNTTKDRNLICASIRYENLLDSELEKGFTDTVQGDFYVKNRHYFSELFNTQVGVRVLMNLPAAQNKKVKFHIPLTVLYERLHYANLTIGKETKKRLDTLFTSEEMFFVDSSDYKSIHYRNLSNRILIQSGINIQTGSKLCNFSAGINLGLGGSFLNMVEISKRNLVLIETTEYYKEYPDEVIYESSEFKRVKGKSSLNFRFLTPFSMKLQHKKSSHFGVYGEITPGFEINQYWRGTSVFRWLIYTSLGLRYVI